MIFHFTHITFKLRYHLCKSSSTCRLQIESEQNRLGFIRVHDPGKKTLRENKKVTKGLRIQNTAILVVGKNANYCKYILIILLCIVIFLSFYKGVQNSKDASLETQSSGSNLPNCGEEADTGIDTFTTKASFDDSMETDDNGLESSLSKQVQDEATCMEFEPCLQVSNLQMSATTSNEITDSSTAHVESLGQNNIQVEQAISSQAGSKFITSATGGAIQTSELGQLRTDQGSSKLIMVNPISKPLFDEESSSPQTQTPKSKPVRQDSLTLVDSALSPKEDDQVFKVLLKNLSPASSCFNHPSVLNEKDNLDVHRCRNTFCDCRLYHCPLCTCLPNKPGRIREHFKKIHGQDLIIRYQGKMKT